jgi:Ca-activated chloride channel family protein
MIKFRTQPLLIKVITGAALLAIAVLVSACSPSAEQLNNQGNEAFAKQAYLVALQDYQSAQIEEPELAEPYYNAANALYRAGEYQKALEQMQQALQYAEDESLAEKGFYNQGNTFYNTQELDPAIKSYINALLLDPTDQDAKYNLELALQQQQEQQEQQEQSEQSASENNQDQADQPQENSDSQDEQHSQADQQESAADQPDQNENSQSEQSPESQDPQDQGQPEQNQAQNNASGQTGSNENQDEGQEQASKPQPGERMTAEQARQLLEALAQNMETLQERLGQILQVRVPPPVQDW